MGGLWFAVCLGDEVEDTSMLSHDESEGDGNYKV